MTVSCLRFPALLSAVFILVACAGERDADQEAARQAELERELIVEAAKAAKEKAKADAESDDVDLTLELLNQGLDGAEEEPQALPVETLGLDAPPLSSAPTGQSQMTDAEKEEFARRLDKLTAEVDATLADIRATQKELDREMEEAVNKLISVSGLSAAAASDRSPECIALTNAIIGGKTYQEIYGHLMGRAELGLSWEQRKPLRDCVMKKDGDSLLVLIIDRVENDWVYGAPSPEWVMDALLTAGEFGARPAGPLADLWTTNFGDKQYIDNGLYWRLTNSSRMSRLRPLVSFIDGWEADLDQLLADNSEFKKMLNDTQNTCWGAQGIYRELPEDERVDYIKIMQEAAPHQQEACSSVGIEIVELDSLPHHKVQWADGVEDLSFRSGDDVVQASDVARLFDDWGKANPEGRWGYSWTHFLHFEDHGKNTYLIGYDPSIHRNGDTMHYVFRVFRVDFDYYRQAMQDYWAPFSDQAYAQAHSIEDAREELSKIILAMEPAAHFLLGHYQRENWTWRAVENDLLRDDVLWGRSKPFHEIKADIDNHLNAQ